MSEKKQFVGSEEIADMLGCAPGTVRKMAREKEIPSLSLGREYRFDPNAVVSALQKDQQTTKKR